MASKAVYLDLDGQLLNKLTNWLLNPLTTTERNSLSPALGANNAGLAVFDTTANAAYYWTGTAWITSSGGGGSITLTTTGISGAATLSGSVLNVPVYQGQITLTTTGSSGAATFDGTTLNIPTPTGGGGGTPGGSDNSIQYAESGAFAGDSNFTWEPVSQTLTVIGGSGPALMVAPSTGNILIGTTTDIGNPLNLQVIGSEYVSGSLYVNSTSFGGFVTGNGVKVNGDAFIVSESSSTGFHLFGYADGNSYLDAFSSAGDIYIRNTNNTRITSSTGGFIPPKYSTATKLALTPNAGTQVYDTDLNQMSYYNGTAWVNI
jgi:hypothetical protein